MAEIIFVLKDMVNSDLHFVQFDDRLSLKENLDYFKLFKGNYRIYYRGYALDLKVPLVKMDLYTGMCLEVYSSL